MKASENRGKTVFLLCGALLGACAAALYKGAVPMDFANLSDIDKGILLYVRIPRILLAGFVGAALALSGVLFQYVMKNPLADSFTTGVSASSAMGAVIAIMSGFGVALPFFALGGGLIGLLAVYKISSVNGRVQPITMLLAGIVISTFASSIISLMKYLADDSVASIIFWLMGGFQGASAAKTAILFVVLVVSYIFVKRDCLSLDIVCFDDATALSSGIDVNRLRRKAFFFAALLTAISVGYAGIIGFVGLIVPHVIRLLRYVKAVDLVPLSMLSGATFMICNDLIARTILPEGQELSVGIITSAIGGLFFLYLLTKRKRELFYFD